MELWLMPLFFVHIPKTAGTSFRLGAERYFGIENIVYDYSPSAPETSTLVTNLLYGGTSDFWRFKKVCEQRQTAMVGGHVNVGRFVSLFGVGQTATFLRDPLQRMASEYAHFVRHNNYEGSFKDFYSRPIIHNLQSKILQGVSLEAIGFMGLTERYSESLTQLNAHYSFAIPQREDNLGKPSFDALHKIPLDDQFEFNRLNEKDILLYQQAITLFNQRHEFFQKGKPWAHARLGEVKPNRVSGWAWWADQTNDLPVTVEILVNDKLLKTVQAVEQRPGLCRLLPPRGGYIGFSLSVNLKVGDQVQCRVSATGQYFPVNPIKVTPV